MEYRVGFEPTVFRICNPVQWAALPPVHILLERNLESFGRQKSDLATRGIQSRSTCLANMEYHLPLRIDQTVCPDSPPGWSMIYNHQILKASDPLYFPLRTPNTLSSLLIKWLRGLDLNQGWQWLMRPRW